MRHVIILGDLLDQSVNEVRQILLDWHLCGLVQRPYWLSLDEGDRFIETLSADGTQRALLSDWLDKHIEVSDQLELISLQMHNDAGLYLHASQFSKAIAGFDPLIKAEAKIINLIAPADIDGSVPAEVLMNYRTNLLAIPTQSSSSRSGHITLKPFTSGFFANVAAAIATAAGIWSGQSHNPIRDLPYPKSRRPEVTMFRSFVRYADASDLVAEVVQDVVKRVSANGLPIAYNDLGNRLSPLNYYTARTDIEQVALGFIEANKSTFDLRQFKDKPTPKIIPITPMGLLREYWRYIKQSFRIGQRLVEKKNEAASAAALAFQKVFLGDDSAMQVFVSGVSGAPTRKADNSLNAVLDLVNAANSLRKTVVQPQSANPRQLWKDFTATATALIDGGKGPNGIELPGVAGGDRRLVVYPELVVPPHRSVPFQVPANLDIPLRGEIIAADNPYLTAVLRDQIDKALKYAESMEPVQIGQLQRTKFELDLWVESKKSFSWFIGMKLGQRINEARNFLSGLDFDNKVDEKSRIEALAKAEAKVKKSVDRILMGLFSILLGGTLVGAVSSFWTFLATAVWPVISLGGLLLPGAIIAGLMTIWNIWGFRSFASAVRDVFKLSHANDMNTAQIEWADSIKDDLANEIKRLGDLYQQYQLWSEVISKPIHDPLGTPEVFANNDGRIKNLNQITSSIQLAELNHEGETLESLVDHVKKKFFTLGWLDRILTSRLESLGATFPQTWLDGGTDDSSPLHRILERSRRSDGRRELGQIVVEELQEMTTADTDYSVWPLSILNMPIERKLQCHEFLEPLATGSSVMPNSLLSDYADVNSASRIDQARSFLLADGRVSLHSDVPKYLVDPSIVELERRLDIINLRAELSKPLHADSITTFRPAIIVVNIEESLTATPEA